MIHISGVQNYRDFMTRLWEIIQFGSSNTICYRPNKLEREEENCHPDG